MKIWHKLSAASDSTGYSPVFPVDGDIDELECQVAPKIQKMQNAVSHATEGQTSGARPNVSTQPSSSQQIAADMFEGIRRVHGDDSTGMLDTGIRSVMLERLKKLTGCEDVGANLSSKQAQIAALRNSAMTGTMPEMMSNLMTDLNKTSAFEREELQKHCASELSEPSVACLIAAGESLDVEKWLALKVDPTRKVGNFDKQKYGIESPPLATTLLLVPVKKSWHIPAVLKTGGWNACPPPHVHVAMLKRWSEKYGAKIITIGKDSLYLTVAKPINTKEEALILASEQFAYCPDNVLQGVGDGTLSGAAVDLLDVSVWQFWWD